MAQNKILHLAAMNASHLERRRPAGFHFTKQPERRSKPMGNACFSGPLFRKEPAWFQFRPVPVLAELSKKLRKSKMGYSMFESCSEAREGIKGLPFLKRTLAAGRIQFTSRSEHSTVKLTKSRMQMSRFVGSNLSRVDTMAAVTGRYFNLSELHCHSGQTRAVYGGTRSVYPGQTQQPNAVQIAIT